MPVIVLASPKGGVGKSTCAVLLATNFARMGAQVIALDCDPNKSLTRWADKGLPPRVKLIGDITASNVIPTIQDADGAGRVVIVDLEGVASQLVSRAISQADLVIVPMQPTPLDAAIGSTAIAVVREEELYLRRRIPHAVALTQTSSIKSRIYRALEADLERAGIDVIDPPLAQRSAFAELFRLGHDLETHAGTPDAARLGNVATAIANAKLFTEAVYARIARTPQHA